MGILVKPLVMAIWAIYGHFDQFYQHRKELSYRDFKGIFENGMAWGTKWEHVEVATVQSVRLRIALPPDPQIHR